jgi:hypothetical protein
MEFISGFWGGWAVESYIRWCFERRNRQGEENIALLKRELESEESKERSAIFNNPLALCMHSANILSGKYVESTLWHPTEHHFYPNDNAQFSRLTHSLSESIRMQPLYLANSFTHSPDSDKI